MMQDTNWNKSSVASPRRTSNRCRQWEREWKNSGWRMIPARIVSFTSHGSLKRFMCSMRFRRKLARRARATSSWQGYGTPHSSEGDMGNG